MAGQFPHVLLPDVLDYLDLSSLLMCVMPVGRYWREQACAHRTYWRDIAYTGCEGHIEMYGRDRYKTEVPKHELSPELLLLRLSRTYGRPIDLSFRWADKAALDALAPHLPHIRSVSLEVLVRHWETTMDTLRGAPAPGLESLSLLVQYQLLLDSDWEYHPFLPCDLFAYHPAALRKVQLSNVGLSPTAELPVCLSSVESLKVYNTHENVHRPLPNVFRRCTRLRKLWIYLRVTLEDPAFLQEETWRGLDELGLHLLTSWDVLALPLAGIPRIIITPGAAPTVLEVVPWLGSRLTVDIPPLRRGMERGEWRFFHADFGVYGDTLPRRRLVQMCFPNERSGSLTDYSLGAFRDAVLYERIVELTLYARNWELLVGMRYFTTFAALERLTLVLSDAPDAMPRPRHEDGKLSCPSLTRLVLRASPGSGSMTVGSAYLCHFARAALESTSYPITLELDDVALSESSLEMEALFTL